jgi:hypothetical protein
LQFPAMGVACSSGKRDCGPPGTAVAAGPEGEVGMHARPTLDYHQDVVEGMMDASEPFGKVETFINEAAALDHDEKAALWLLAWSLRGARAQRKEALDTLHSLAWRSVPG